MLLNGGSVIQAPSGGVILNGLALGDNQTITLAPPVAAPSPPILFNGSTTLLSGKAQALNSHDVPRGPPESLPPATILSPTALPGEVKSEAAEALAFGVEVKLEDEPTAVPPLLSLPDPPTLLSDHKGALLATVSMSQVVPSNEEATKATPLPLTAQPVTTFTPQIVPLAKLSPSTQPLPSPQVTVASPATPATPLLSMAGSSPPQATVLQVPAPSLVPIAQVSPPSQVVPLSQPVSGTQVLSPSQMVPMSPSQIYTVSQGAPPATQLVSLPQVAQGSPIISLPQVVPTSQVVTLQQGVGSPIQFLTSSAPIKVGSVAGTPQATVASGSLGQSNVHLINTNVGMTALQLPGATPGIHYGCRGVGKVLQEEGA